MDDNDVERRATAKVAWRFVPFLVLCYFVAYLDRVNVGCAKLTMDADIGITDTMFGFGAGVVFLAYFLLEVPSNLALDRVGARRWIARNLQIMDTAAFALARDNGIPIVVFSINEPGAIRAALLGQGRATYVMP